MMWYSKILCHHPYAVLSSVVVVVGTCLVLSLTARPLPNFNDPALGFESRGTVISERATAWENLLESTGARGPLTANPLANPYFNPSPRDPFDPSKEKPQHTHQACIEFSPTGEMIESQNCSSIDNKTRSQGDFARTPLDDLREYGNKDGTPKDPLADIHYGDHDDDLLSFRDVHDAHHSHEHSNGFFCNDLVPEYGHVVVGDTELGEGLFTLGQLRLMCKLDALLRTPKAFQELCEHSSPGKCCPSWSVPNFVAMLARRKSCFDITEEDVQKSRRLLRKCARYLDLQLENGCGISGCRKVDKECLANNTVYTILHFLTDAAFLQPQVSGIDQRPHTPHSSVNYETKAPHSPHGPQSPLGQHSPQTTHSDVLPPDANSGANFNNPNSPPGHFYSKGGPQIPASQMHLKTQRHHLQQLGQRRQEDKLSLATIFLPIPKAATALPYFEALREMDLSIKNMTVVAMDLGLKNSLFHELLVADSFLLGVGGGIVVMLIWFYTGSLFITLITITTVACSLLIAYVLYVFVYKIAFFPYMNVLTAVIAIGLGADDTFVYCRVWNLAKQDPNCATMIKLVSDAIHHAAASICVTSFTTAAAFLASCTSHITAVKCFSIFAGTVVLANLVLMVTWVPACVVVAERWGASSCCLCVPPAPVYATSMNPRCSKACALPLKFCYSVAETGKVFFEKVLPCMIIKPRHFWIILLGGLASVSAIVVLYYPGLRLPDTQDFQLFDREHPFEKYDLKYKYNFWFERNLRRDIVNILPIRLVWGIKPVDNGDYLDPSSKGTLVYDDSFDMSDPQSQVWLLQFCRDLRNQTFYKSTLGPLLPNCFIERFKVSMENRCSDPNGFNRYPCCENSSFPFTRDVFDMCITHEIRHLYETPNELFIPGVAGPKFDMETKKIKAVVVEYDSNFLWSLSYEDMDEFFNEVEGWVTERLKDAPPGMKNGWFTSYLNFYDVQKSLSIGTGIAVAVAVSVCLAVLLLTTLNFIVSLLAVISVAAVMLVTLAALVLMGWRLNVLESVTVSVAIGLAVDLTLHYGVAYRFSPEPERDGAVVWATARLGGPVFMAALTSVCAGAAMMPARVLAYVHVGTFFMILTALSYIYATFFYLPLLRIFGPQNGFGQLSYPDFRGRCCRRNSQETHADKPVYQQAFISESTLSTSSNCCPNPSAGTTATTDTHELEPLTTRGSTRSNSKKRHSSVSRVSSLGHQSASTDDPQQHLYNQHQHSHHQTHIQHNGGVGNVVVVGSLAEDVTQRCGRSGSLSSSGRERRKGVLRKISLPSPNGKESCEMAEPSPKRIVAPALSATTILYSEPDSETGSHHHHHPHQRLPPQSPSYAQQYAPVKLISPKRHNSCDSQGSAGTDSLPA